MIDSLQTWSLDYMTGFEEKSTRTELIFAFTPMHYQVFTIVFIDR